MAETDKTPSGPAKPGSRFGGAWIGAMIGAIAIVGWVGWAIYDKAATPMMPNIQTASAPEVIAFVVNERGLMRLPKFDQDRFLVAWQKHYAGSDQQRALKKFLEGSDEASREAVRNVLYRIGKRQFFENAREYQRLSKSGGDTYKFLVGNIQDALAQTAWIKGNGDPSRDLSAVMAVGLPRNPEDLVKLIVTDTSPEERVIGEKYIEALRNVREQEKKRSKGTKDEQPAQAPPKK